MTKSATSRTKLTPELQEALVQAIRAGNYAAVAVQYAGISRSTFYRWMQRGQRAKSGLYCEFFEAIRRAESQAEVRAVAILQGHMKDSWRAAMTFLERKYPDRWGRKDRLKIDIEPRQALAELLGMEPDEIDSMVDAAVEHKRDESVH